MEGSVLSLQQRTLDNLVLRLESQFARLSWKGLAEWVGFNARHISRISAPHSGPSSTCMMLTAWDRSGRSSLKKLIIALKCLEREDCLCVLREEPALKGVDFQGLYHIAERLKDNYAERKAWFPDFKDSDLIIGDDVWISAQPPSAQSPATHCHEWVCRDLRQGCCRQNTSELAGSPDEENPPSSVTPSEATDVCPSRRGVYISFYPSANTRSWVEQIAGQLVANDFIVQYATDRQRADPDFIQLATMKSYNILILCTQRYCDEDRRLLTQHDYQSKIAFDRSVIRDIFFKDQQRVICVTLDEDGPNFKQCIPQLYSPRPVYRYPSQVRDLLHCVSDVPKFIAPEPKARIRLEPKKIAFHKEVKEFNARNGIPSPQDTKGEGKMRVRPQHREEARVVLSTPLSLAPRKIRTSKTPLWKKLLPTAVK